MPEGAEGVYWYVVGARTINGAPAGSFQPGQLSASDLPSIKIEWDSLPRGNIQLRRMRQDENQDAEPEPEVLASRWFNIFCPICAIIVNTTTVCDPKIYYAGIPNTTTVSQQIKDYTYVCSGVSISGAEKRSNYSAPWVCFGLRGYPGFPAITWRVDYITENSGIYRESWASPSVSSLFTPTKSISITWFDQVPNYRNQSDPGPKVYPSPALPTNGTLLPNPLAGQRIEGHI